MHVLDYTFEDNGQDAAKIRNTLAEYHLDTDFSELFEMKVGYIRTTEDYHNVFASNSVMETLSKLPKSDARDVLLNNLSHCSYPYLISLTGYNQLLEIAGLPALELNEGEAAVYMDNDFISYDRTQILNTILADKPEAMIDGDPIHLTGTVQSVNLVTDRSITLSFALILPDDAFSYYTKGESDIYLNGVLSSAAADGTGLMTAISEMNEKLDGTGLDYGSYLQNIGRQLFYIVAASYITIYLAIIFLIIANTVIGVQFLMGQQKTNKRYKTLIRLGATYEILCQSAEKQINWYFGIPTIVAAVNSLFGVRALFSGLLSSRIQGNLLEFMLVSGAMILALCIVEYIYMTAVKHSSNRYLLTLMVPEREE